MITKSDVENAQRQWGEGVVALGKLKGDYDACLKAASNHTDNFYNYGNGAVLFKPTRAEKIQFRTTREGAISYFIGENSNFPEDTGFAMQPWTKVRFENAELILEENRAFAMGNYFFTDTDGNEKKVEYTFGYQKTESGELKIDIHHSSNPFSTPTFAEESNQ